MVSLARINIIDIIIAHLRTLRRLGTPGIYSGDILLFFILPAIISIPLAYFFGDRLYEQAAKILTSTSLVGGFLFNLLARIGQIVDKVKKETELGSVKRVFAKEIHSNVSFGIIIAIGCSISLVIFSFMEKPTLNQMDSNYLFTIMAWFNYFLSIAFFLTLLMIVKRMFIILNSDAQEL